MRVQECVTIILTSSLYNLKAIYLHDVIQKDTTVTPETRNISKRKLRFMPLHGSLLYAWIGFEIQCFYQLFFFFFLFLARYATNLEEDFRKETPRMGVES